MAGALSEDFQSCLATSGNVTINNPDGCGAFTAVRSGSSVTLSTSAGKCETDTTTGVFSCGAGNTSTVFTVS